MKQNNEKILDVLKEVNRAITTTELAEKTDIAVKNIGRYTKELESEGYIERKTIQEGKVRLVMISLRPVRLVKEIKHKLPTTPKQATLLSSEDKSDTQEIGGAKPIHVLKEKYDVLTLLKLERLLEYGFKSIHNKSPVKEYRSLIENENPDPARLIEVEGNAYVKMYRTGKKVLKLIEENK